MIAVAMPIPPGAGVVGNTNDCGSMITSRCRRCSLIDLDVSVVFT
jgi:hypothetical protein